MADLYIDSQALADFAGQLRELLADFSAPIVSPWEGWCDGSIFDALTDFSSTDGACGNSLNNYLTALAGLAGQAAQAAQNLDTKLASDVPSHTHHTRIQEAF